MSDALHTNAEGRGPAFQYMLDGRPIRDVSVTMRFGDGTKVRMNVSGEYARRVIRALTMPEDDPRWEVSE